MLIEYNGRILIENMDYAVKGNTLAIINPDIKGDIRMTYTTDSSEWLGVNSLIKNIYRVLIRIINKGRI